MLNLICNLIFFATMLQMAATAAIFAFMEDRVMEFACEPEGVEAFERFIAEFGPTAGPSYRQQLKLMHYWQGFTAFLNVVGMFLFGNYRLGHVFASVGCAGFAAVLKVGVATVSSFPQTQGNEAMIENAPQGIMVFTGLAAANLVAFLVSKKPSFPSADDCKTENSKNKQT